MQPYLAQVAEIDMASRRLAAAANALDLYVRRLGVLFVCFYQKRAEEQYKQMEKRLSAASEAK